jgi:hypothetical protein
VGVADPIGFLAHEGPDWDIALAVVRKARELKDKQHYDDLKAVIDAVGKSVGNQVAKQIGQMFR